MSNISVNDFQKVKEKGEALYRTFGQVYCPYFKEKVSFNAQGLEHLNFKKPFVARFPDDQYRRYRVISLAPEVVRLSHTLQGIRFAKRFEKIKVHSRIDTVLLPVTYYEFIALIGKDRVKVILKQIEGGEKFFWSIIPFWDLDPASRQRLFDRGIAAEE